MIEVAGKEEREASAEAVIVLAAEGFDAVGEAFAAARIAAILAAKKTGELVPLCQEAGSGKIEIAFEPDEARHAVRICAKAGGRGAEMEVLTAVTVAALNLFESVRAIDKNAVIETVRLVATGKAAAAPPLRALRKTGVAPVRARPLGEVMSAPAAPAGAPAEAQRAGLRAFMAARHLRASEWAKKAGIPAAQLYAFLTGRLHRMPDDVIHKLARVAGTRPEDLLR